MNTQKITRQLMLTCVNTLALCALFTPFHTALAEQHAINWQVGAKLGTIALFYSNETPAKDLPECLSLLSKEELATKHYVKVWYHHGRLIQNEVAELPSDLLHAKLEDHVEIWPADCSKGKLSRISQVFASPH